MNISLHDVRRLLFVAGVTLSVYAAPAAALPLPLPTLHVNASGFLYDPSVGGVGPFQNLDANAGPLTTNVEAGAVLAYRYPGVFPDFALEATLFARAQASADYGTNGAAVKSGLRPVSGTDRGAFPQGQLTGNLGLGTSSSVQMFSESVWTDTFVIVGGTGLGTATINVTLSGIVTTGYGENGTIWYDAEPAFEAFGTSGFGFVTYSLGVRYDVAPVDFGSDGPPPVIHLEESFFPPLPAFIQGVIPRDILTGSFIFEYGVPFALNGYIVLSGYNQIDMDYGHTATLSLFDLPDGASLTSGSGRSYPISLASPVPEPATLALFAIGLAGLGFSRRKRAAN